MHQNHRHNFNFLKEGGEMGELIRSKDWDNTRIGNPSKWEQSLKTKLNNILNSNFPLFLFWGDDLVSFYNDAYRQSLGQNGKHPHILGLPAKEAWAEIWDTIKPYIDIALAGKSTWFEDQLIPIYRNGRMEDVYWTFSHAPVYDEDGNVKGVLVNCFETTEKVMTLNKLEESKEKLKIVVEASELATWELNLKTKEVAYSDKYLEMLGYPKDTKLTHEEILKHIHPDDLDKRQKAVAKAMKTGVLDYELRVVWNDGTIHWLEAKGKIFYDKDNNPEKTMGAVRDITYLKKHEQELMESEQKFRLLADSIPHQVWTTDDEGKLNYVNQTVYNYSGMSFDEMQVNGLMPIVHPEEQQKNIEIWNKAISTGETYSFEHRLKKINEEYRWHTCRAVPKKDANGKIQMWVGTSIDIQEQKMFTTELEKQVHKRTKELEEINKELQSFAYISSHDLQEPLRKIQIFSNRIVEMEFENLSNTGKDYFERMTRAAQRMQVLIDDLLAYSRTNNAEKKLVKSNLKTIVEDVKEELKEDLQQKNGTIEIGELPTISVIPFQFRQLVYNLISNSLKFAKPNVAPIIIINSEMIKGSSEKNNKLNKDEIYCHIAITDNGIGFEPEYNEKIFELFQRLHGKNEYNGTGIGLAIVKKIIANHNGFISAKGELNKGAGFDIYLPVSTSGN